MMNAAILCLLSSSLCRRTVSVGLLQDLCASVRLLQEHSRQEVKDGGVGVSHFGIKVPIEHLQCIVSPAYVTKSSLHAVPGSRREASRSSSTGSRCSLYPSRLKILEEVVKSKICRNGILE